MKKFYTIQFQTNLGKMIVQYWSRLQPAFWVAEIR